MQEIAKNEDVFGIFGVLFFESRINSQVKQEEVLKVEFQNKSSPRLSNASPLSRLIIRKKKSNITNRSKEKLMHAELSSYCFTLNYN